MDIESPTCPNCGAPIKQGANTCEYCGRAIELPKDKAPEGFTYCVICGIGVTPHSSFKCPICGRHPLCLKHRVEEQVLKEDEIEVKIPACCEDCFKKELERARPQIAQIQKREKLRKRWERYGLFGCFFFMLWLCSALYAVFGGPYGAWVFGISSAFVVLIAVLNDRAIKAIEKHKRELAKSTTHEAPRK